MDRKKKIIRLYFDEKLNVVNIANICKVTKQYVSQVIMQDNRYNNEKSIRIENTKIAKKLYTNNKMKEIRDIKKQIDAYMNQQHIQASKELSGGNSIISNRALLKWNASAYKYNANKECYEFDRKLIKSYALPKYIKFK